MDSPHGHSGVDPEAVDLIKYPGLIKAPWWEAHMEAGDCLFIPVLSVITSYICFSAKIISNTSSTMLCFYNTVQTRIKEPIL